MRNFTVVVICFITVIFGCKLESGSYIDKDSNKIAVIGNLNSSSPTWTKKYRQQFLIGCIEKAQETINSVEAEKYCNCMAEKVQQKYPDESNVNAGLTQDEIEIMRSECLEGKKVNVTSSIWSSADMQEFLNSCASKMRGSLGADKAKEYCNCLIKKVVIQSPEVNSTEKITQTQLAGWGTDCLKQ